VKIKDMDQNFALTRAMLVSLCDEVSRGTLAPEMLRPIGFPLIASDKFDFPDDDDDVFREVVHDWSCPEVNYPLTLENVRRFRKWLLNEEPRPKKGEPREGGKIVSILEKKQIT